VIRLDAHAERGEALDGLIARLGRGAIVALVTDAGTPVVSDPGTALVRAARAAGAIVTPVPGPSAVTTAASVSGLVAGPFRFVGFLPRSGEARRESIARIAADDEPQILFEAPRRLGATLADLAAAVPAREAAICRELTKLHEEILVGALADLAARAADREWLGEITLVVGPRAAEERARRQERDDDILGRIDEALARGERPRELSERLALETGRPRRELYALAVRRRPPSP
jgi:16S rRNA (cytidine1402-2'-O)-methyltransferase